MAPKSKKKKVDTFMRWDESLDPSGLVNEYPILELRVVATRVTLTVTSGQVHQTAKTIIWGNMGQPFPKHSWWGKIQGITYPRSCIEGIKAT